MRGNLLLGLPRQHILARWFDRLCPVAVAADGWVSRASGDQDGGQEQHRYQSLRHVESPLISAWLIRELRGVLSPTPLDRQHGP